MQLTLFTRVYCHLCHDMAQALLPLQAEYGFTVEEIDVDADQELEARYNEWVPVLAHGGHELCHHFLDEAAVRAYLDRTR